MTEIEIHGGAKYPNRDMAARVAEIARKTYGIEVDLSGTDLSSYYRPDGAKITKTLTAILRKTLDRNVVQGKFADFAREVSGLYTVGTTLNAFFGDKKKIGEGVYESGKTCFREGGENELSKKFLVKFRWTKLLVLQDKKNKDAVARCICYFGGGRNIFLTNFYFKGIQQNHLYFITAIRTLLKMKKVLYCRNPKFFFPIYKNGDAIRVYDERSKFPKVDKLVPCPNCSKPVREIDMYYEEAGATRMVGCSERCARANSKHYVACQSCKEPFHQNDMIVAGETKQGHPIRYCRACFRKASKPCPWCDGPMVGSKCKVEGVEVCYNCAKSLPTCCECGSRILRDNAVHVSGGTYCKKCLAKIGTYCEVCRTISHEKCVPVTLGHRTIMVCKECREPAPGVDLGVLK